MKVYRILKIHEMREVKNGVEPALHDNVMYCMTKNDAEIIRIFYDKEKAWNFLRSKEYFPTSRVVSRNPKTYEIVQYCIESFENPEESDMEVGKIIKTDWLAHKYCPPFYFDLW